MIYVITLAIISTLGLFVALYLVKSNFTSPLSLHCFAWFLVTTTGLFAYDEFIEFPEISFYALMIWYTIVYIILITGELVSLKINSTLYYENREYVCGRYWIIVIPLSIYTVYEIYNVGNNGPASFLLNLRLANIIEDYEGEKFTLMTTVYPVLIAMFSIVCITERNKKNKYTLWLWMILFCIGTMGKFALITPILIFLVIREMTVGLNKKKLFFIVPAIIFAILFMHFMRMSSGESTTVSSVLGIYIYSPLLALSKLSELNTNGEAGEYTFRFLIAVLYKTGLSSTEPVKTILDYVNVPVPTNVFTVMQPFYQDYSLLGVAFGAILYGVIYSTIYLLAKKGNPLALLIYASFAIGLFTSFFAETLITNLAGNIKVVICMYLLWRFTVKCKIKQ
ncbi:TPA: oligosaccharide repeat unit polymerase [Citrobacter sedlakii]|nr:oligosaccharide repeat unit polymerase [Citrobacter sedlakii]